MTLADYLAKNYLNADSGPAKKSKKRKRRAGDAPAETTGLVIEDDDASGWEPSKPSRRGKGSGRGNGDDDDEDDDDADADGPMTVASARSAEFRKAKTSNWRTLSGEKVQPSSLSSYTAPISEQQQGNTRKDDDAAADAILASVVAENAARQDAENDDDAPAVDDEGRQALLMESGAKAGLQSAASLTAQLRRARAREDAAAAAAEADPEAAAKMHETIYRDASGRVVNVAMKRAEARAAAAAEERRRRQEADEAAGDVQRADRERRRDELADAKFLTVARYADDAELNREQRGRERWNDPALQFMPAASATEEKKAGTSQGSGRPLYKGDWAPNRYNIRPGHRWDGVDRSTGFERDYFAARNRRANVAGLEYAWQLDE